MSEFVCVFCVCAHGPPGGQFSGIHTFFGRSELITQSPGVIKELNTVRVSLVQINSMSLIRFITSLEAGVV